MKADETHIDQLNIEVYKKVLNGELDKFPRHFWKEEYRSAPALVRYLIEEVLQWDEEDIKEKFCVATLEKNKLSGLLKYVYDKKAYLALEDAYPNRFLPWDFKTVPNDYWRDEENCIKATRWLVNDKLKWSKEDVMEKFNKNVFAENKFTGLLKWGWNGDTYKAITKSFPEYDLRPWDLATIPLTHITREQAVEALREYIEEKEQWSLEEIPEKWRARYLYQTGVQRIVRTCFNNNLYEAINAVYPDHFKQWQFPVPNGYWSLELAKEVLRWLVLEELKLPPKDAWAFIDHKTIDRYGLRGMLELGFKTGLREAIKTTFDV